MIRNKRTWLAMATLLLVCLSLLTPFGAFAQDQMSGAPDVKTIAQNGSETANGVFMLIQSVVCLVGFIIVCIGVYGFYRVNKEKGQGQASIATSFVGCIVGVLMVMLPLTVGTLGKTVFGDQAGRPQRINITPQ
ncbi:hypothetical protein [Xanthomonas campestris]|uniref:hypothetical protein n=1 Tax=Xanthomonas campestris TaxID=339 RepID=UPI0023687FD2|nr:hypothetical protein [Xanthomonas campestris]MEB1409520.1 hypothetical protein [Xanthomonas campestris pv. campestris]MEB1509502.1 hypothetical protein [Xanthomonas campestris pv. campestris]MEB1704854.1 hypothetical protein [Xanthomonas campestris pv. campestris]MEB1724818.1 hypothetical protein [Xanthomonas campestris pv. campestris]MEB1763532.1 hypothetical protein [Xanthomonas campestris pv. campestris]